MSFIICATDFKEAALNAIHYSCGLCRQYNCELIILHSQSISNKIVKVIHKTDVETMDKMNNLVKKVRLYYPDVTINGEVLSGNVIESLHNYTLKKGDPLLVVVGNNYNPENPAFMDGNLLQIFKNLKCPVVAIPTNKTFQPLKKICFAFDNNIHGAESALRDLTRFVVARNVQLHVIIGWADGISRDNLPEIYPAADKIISAAKPVHHFINMKNLNSEINDFAVKHHMDWLAILPRHRSYVSELVHKSHTQYMINNTDFPIMALHEE